MITWVTVWVLTVYTTQYQQDRTYQLTYKTQELCIKQKSNHISGNSTMSARCDFQQIPVVVNK